MNDILFWIAVAGFAVGTSIMSASVITASVAIGAPKTRLRAFIQWLAISLVSLFIAGFFAIESGVLVQ